MLQAFAKHNKMMKDCSTGKGTYIRIILTFLKKPLTLKNFFWLQMWGFIAGFDRHLLGLSLIAKEEGLPIPELFTDPVFSKRWYSGVFYNFIKQFVFLLNVKSSSEAIEASASLVKYSFFMPHSGGGGNFVLSTSLIGYFRIQGVVAPMVHNGYGFFYHIRDNRWGCSYSSYCAIE